MAAPAPRSIFEEADRDRAFELVQQSSMDEEYHENLYSAYAGSFRTSNRTDPRSDLPSVAPLLDERLWARWADPDFARRAARSLVSFSTGPFQEKMWNVTTQMPRASLQRIEVALRERLADPAVAFKDDIVAVLARIAERHAHIAHHAAHEGAPSFRWALPGVRSIFNQADRDGALANMNRMTLPGPFDLLTPHWYRFYFRTSAEENPEGLSIVAPLLDERLWTMWPAPHDGPPDEFANLMARSLMRFSRGPDKDQLPRVIRSIATNAHPRMQRATSTLYQWDENGNMIHTPGVHELMTLLVNEEYHRSKELAHSRRVDLPGALRKRVGPDMEQLIQAFAHGGIAVPPMQRVANPMSIFSQESRNIAWERFQRLWDPMGKEEERLEAIRAAPPPDNFDLFEEGPYEDAFHDSQCAQHALYGAPFDANARAVAWVMDERMWPAREGGATADALAWLGIVSLASETLPDDLLDGVIRALPHKALVRMDQAATAESVGLTTALVRYAPWPGLLTTAQAVMKQLDAETVARSLEAARSRAAYQLADVAGYLQGDRAEGQAQGNPSLPKEMHELIGSFVSRWIGHNPGEREGIRDHQVRPLRTMALRDARAKRAAAAAAHEAYTALHGKSTRTHMGTGNGTCRWSLLPALRPISPLGEDARALCASL